MKHTAHSFLVALVTFEANVAHLFWSSFLGLGFCMVTELDVDIARY